MPEDTKKPEEEKTPEKAMPKEESKQHPEGGEDTPQPQPDLPRRVFMLKCSHEKVNRECIEAFRELEFELSDLDDKKYSGEPVEQLFQKHPDVKFAAVLLSGDEFVYPKKGAKPTDAMLCAAQDTVFKLGYILSKLGRHNTFILYHEQKSFLLPTKNYNAVFTPHDKLGVWHKSLVTKLKILGYDIKEGPKFKKFA